MTSGSTDDTTHDVAGPEAELSGDSDHVEGHFYVPLPGDRKGRNKNHAIPPWNPQGQQPPQTSTAPKTSSPPPGADTKTPPPPANTPAGTTAPPPAAPGTPPAATPPPAAGSGSTGPASSTAPAQPMPNPLSGTPLDPANLPKMPAVDPAAASAAAGAALGAATSVLTPALGILSQLAMMQSQFGQGAPAIDSTPFPGMLNNNLMANQGTADASWAGTAREDYSDRSSKQGSKNEALDKLDKRLKNVLTNSGENSRLGRAKIQQIMDTVNAQLTALAPMSSTAVGQAQIASVITNAITSAGGVVSQGQSTSGVNATAVRQMAGQYVADTSASGSQISSTSRPGSVDAHIDEAMDHLGITDPAARERWKKGYRVLIKRESGGDPNVFNKTDSNAAKGTPSGGLTQTIQSTFNENHVPGTSTNMLDPTANIAASMNYVMRQYDVDPSGVNLAANVQQADPTREPKGY